jgi:hypothetical protein
MLHHFISTWQCETHLWDRVGALGNKAVVLATSIALEVGRESRIDGEGGLDGDDEVAGEVSDPCDWYALVRCF